MALFSECSLQCARKVLDTADIVRDAIYRQQPRCSPVWGQAGFQFEQTWINRLNYLFISQPGSALLSRRTVIRLTDPHQD
jgi:hypothetical protein